MGLEINREKTRVVDLREQGTHLDFLGYTFRYQRDLWGRQWRYLSLQPSKQSVARMREAIRQRTMRRQCFKPMPRVIDLMMSHRFVLDTAGAIG
jgi:RNA-directed DNA polymerase